MTKLAKVAALHDIRRVVVETNFGDGMFEKLLQPHMVKYCGPVQIDSKRSSGQKELRILDTMEPLVYNHRLVLDTRVAKDIDLMTQYTRITRERGSLKHDDRLEALSGACSELSDLAVLDPETKVEELAMAAKEQMAAEWVKAATTKGWNSGNNRFSSPSTPELLHRRKWGGGFKAKRNRR